MKRARRALRRAAGTSLLETVVALTIFAALGYGLALAAAVGNGSQRQVLRKATENRSVREALALVAGELRSTSDASIATLVLPDGNTRLRFMQPIVDAGVNAWGVYDRRLGNTPALQNRLNWLVEYTVVDAPLPSGGTEKQLVRRILDTAQVAQRTDVLAHGLRAGNGGPPGFRVAQSGAVWEVTLSTEGELDSNLGKSTVMHVNTRN